MCRLSNRRWMQVDERRQAVLLPIYGVMVPFHIMTIKSASCNQDSDHALVRINFNYMGQYEPATKFPGAIFLKELSFRSSDPRRATNAVHQISALRRSVINTFKEKAERATLVKQEKLVKGKRVYRLPDVWVRPTFGGKGRKVTGILEAHSNGFRYSNPKGEELDVMYRNIKHAFFQPADGEMITLVHFHLENPIMVGKKKTKDVQFYTEVMDVVQTLDAGRRAAYDPDEIDDEQRERDRRNKINQEFQQFVKKVQDLWEREHGQLGLEFEVPFRDLGFYGVPSRSTCFLMPTNNALVELIEQPFTVVTLDEIEIVNLERVGMHLKNFDMAIVFKDYSREVLRVDAIPSSSQDTVKDWLTTSQLKYYENKLNLSWKQVLKAIMEDPEAFINDGGWEFLNMERSDEEGEDEDEASEEFKPESSDDDGSDDDDDSDAESLVESDQGDDEEGSDDDEDEEEGKDWDQLEDEARRADKAREGLSDDEEERPRKRRR